MLAVVITYDAVGRGRETEDVGETAPVWSPRSV